MNEMPSQAAKAASKTLYASEAEHSSRPGPSNQEPRSFLGRIRGRVQVLVEAPLFSSFIIAVICINAVTLGLETSPQVMDAAGPFLIALDRTALAIFVVEIALKLFALGPRFFRNGWNLFDFIVVSIALIPSAGAFSVLRALRILRTLRLLSILPQLRAVIGALIAAVPGMGGIIAVLILVFYIAAVMATKLFAASFPQWFGDVGSSMYTLFQIMTLESWSMGIVRPVMETHPWAWIFFVPFIVVTSFTVLNLFIALIVNSLQMIHDAELREERDETEKSAQDLGRELLSEVKTLRGDMAHMKKRLDDLEPGGAPRPDDR